MVCGDNVLEGLGKLLKHLFVLHLGGVDARLPLRLGAVEFLWYQADLTAYQGVVCVTVCTVAAAGEKHVLEVRRLTMIMSS